MIPASELKVLVGVYGITEANKKLAKFDGGLKALASSDPTVTLHAEVDTRGFAEFEALKATAGDPATTTLRAEIEDLGFEEAGIKKAIFEDAATTRLRAEVDDLGFEEGGLKKHIFEEEATTHLRAETSGFDTVIAQMDAVRTMAQAPIVQEVKLEIDKSSLAALALEDAVIAASTTTAGVSGGAGEVATRTAERTAEETVIRNSSRAPADDAGLLAAILASAGGGGHGKGPLGTLAWGNHSPGSSGPWWMKAMMGGGKLAGAGSLGAFAGFGAEHFLFSGLGVAGSAGAGALGGGLMAGGALATQLVGGGSDMAVSKATIADATELGKSYQKLQEQIALYGAHSKEAARAAAGLHLQEREMGPASHAELELAKSGTALGHFWDEQTAKARENSTKVLGQFVQLGHDYVPLVAHAAEQNLAEVNKGLKPLFSWLEGPEGTGIFEHLEEEFAHNLPTAMDALDQGTEFVIKTLNVASESTGGFIHSVDDFFTKWNNPKNFAIWEGHMEHLIGDFRLWEGFVKALGSDIIDLFSQDAGSGEAIVVTLTEMLTRLDEWETSTEGKEELHNLFVVHKEEILALLQVIPPLISSLEPIYMTVAPPLVEAMTEILTVAADFLHLMDETGPVTRWAVGLTLIGLKLGLLKGPLALLGKQLWSPFESLLAKDPLIGRFFEEQVTETEGLTGTTEGLTAAVGDLTTAYEAMGAAAATAGDEAAAAAAGTQMSLLGETTAAESAAAASGQTSFFPMGAGLAPAAEHGAESTAVTGAEDVAGGGALAAIGAKLKGFADDAAGSMFAKAGAVAAGYFAAEFGAKLIAPGALEGQNLEQALLHGFNTEHVAATEARALGNAFAREIDNALAAGGDPKALEDASHNRARTIARSQTEAIRDESSVLETLQSGMVTRLGDITHLAQEGATAAAAAFGEGSPQWHKASADNMQAAIQAIKAGEKSGLITTEEGQHQISHYLREYNLVSGDDPFHIASAFTHTWADAGHVSEQGISKALAELRKMPPVSQAIAEQTMLRQIKEFEKGGQVAKGTFSRLRSAIVTELQQTRLHGGAQVEHFAEEMEGSFGTLSLSVAGALENIGGNVGALLEQLGGHNPLQSFTLHYLHGQGVAKGSGSKYLGQVGSLERQEGGFTIPGTAEGDRHPMMLPYGSFIMNREATAAHRLQSGGHVPVLGESGERVFLPPEVAAIGASRLEWMNSSVPRFQHGGMLGAEPQLQGPQGALLTLGDAAIHTGYAEAQKYLDAHRPKTSTGSFSLSGGAVATPLQFAEYMIQAGFPQEVKVIQEGLGTILSESAFKKNNGQGPGGHIGPWAESPAFGSVKVREDPLGSTEAAYRVGYAPTHSFWGAWGQWEAEQSGLAGGGAGSYGAQFRSTAEEALGQRGGRKPQRTGASAAEAHRHGFADGGLVGPPLFHGEGPQYYGAALKHNQAWATHQAPWSTKLTHAEEMQFLNWGRDIDGNGHGLNWFGFDPARRKNDYDMRGFWKATGGVGPASNGHFTDAFKTPYDTTFSNESKYAKPGTPFTWTSDYKWLYDRRSGQEISSGKFAEGGLVDPRAVARHPGTHLTPEQHAAYLAWKWGRRMTGGGLIEQEESRLGVPNSSAASAAKKATSEAESRETPTEIVHWAMEHIGQKSPWDSEYPGEWCGDFLADDFRTHGMSVPGGYPSAESWGSYGSALGRGHMQAGAVIDYGGQHVALAISASQMIQGNDHNGVVGTSEIVGSVGGSPITAVRWPDYSKGHGPGAGSAPVEKVPGTFQGAQTHAINPPSVPNTLHGIAVEMQRWRGELDKYERAVHGATGRPKLQHALTANVTRIQKYLRELDRAQHKVRKELAKKHYSHHLSRQLGKITGEEKNIELAQRAYETADQYAEQVVGLEPSEPTLQQLPQQAEGESEKAYEAKTRGVEEANHGSELDYLHTFEAFVEGRERPAYANVLGAEADWRNTIIGAENKATGLEANWETQISSDDAIMRLIPKHFGAMKKRVAKWQEEHPNKDLPTILGREWDDAQHEMHVLMPELRFQDKELRKVLGEARQAFYPGFPKALQPPQPPLPGSGEFEQELQEVQGIHWPAQHEHLAAAALAPPRHAGSFGGAIWDTQSAIEELGISVGQAQSSIGSVASGVGGAGASSAPSAAEKEHTELVEGLLREANEEKEINASLGPVLGQFEHSYPLPYMGAYAAGGVALVGEKGPELAHFPSGTRVHTADDTRAMLGRGDLKVIVNGHINQTPGDTRDPIEVLEKDPRAEEWVHRVTGSKQRPVVTGGATRAWR